MTLSRKRQKDLKTKKKEIKEERDELRSLNDLKNYFDDNGETFHFSKDKAIYQEGNNSNYIYLIMKRRLNGAHYPRSLYQTCRG